MLIPQMQGEDKMQHQEPRYWLSLLYGWVLYVDVCWWWCDGDDGDDVQGTSVLSPIGPIGLLIGLAVTIWMKSPTDVFQNNIVLYIVSFGVASSKIANKLVVSLALMNWCNYYCVGEFLIDDEET